MNMSNEFRVRIPCEQAWYLLTDLAAIAPCMPGAQLTGVAGGIYSGRVKVKVGPVTSEFAGTACFVEKDGDGYRAVISAKGRDPRGTGSAKATIVAQLRSEGGQTVVHVDTDLKISGRIAQFGSGMIAKASEKLLGQFVECLEDKLSNSQVAGTAGHTADESTTGAGNGVRQDAGPAPADGSDIAASPSPASHFQPRAEPQAVDLLKLVGRPMVKRLIPVVVGVAVVGFVVYRVLR